MYRMCQDQDESSISSSFWSSEEEQGTDDDSPNVHNGEDASDEGTGTEGYDSPEVQTREDPNDKVTHTNEGDSPKGQTGENGTEDNATIDDTGSDEDADSNKDDCRDVTSAMTSGYGTFRLEDQRVGEDYQMRDDKEDTGSWDSFYDDAKQESEDDKAADSGVNVPHEDQKEPENQERHWDLNASTNNENDRKKPVEIHQSYFDLLPDTRSDVDQKKPEEDHQSLSDLHPDATSEDFPHEDEIPEKSPNELQSETKSESDKNKPENQQTHCDLEARIDVPGDVKKNKEEDHQSVCALLPEATTKDIPHEDKEKSHYDLRPDTRSENGKTNPENQQTHCDLHPDIRSKDVLDEDRRNHQLRYDLFPDTIKDGIPYEDKKMRPLKPENKHSCRDIHHEKENPKKSGYDLHSDIRGEDVPREDEAHQVIHDLHPESRKDNHVPYEEKMKPEKNDHPRCDAETCGNQHVRDEDFLLDQDEAVAGLLLGQGEDCIRKWDKNLSHQDAEEESCKKHLRFVDLGKDSFTLPLDGNLRRQDCSAFLQDRLSGLRLHEAQSDKASVLSDDMEGVSLSSFGSFITHSTRTRSESDFRTKPKSFIRPVLTQQTFKKDDPVARYFQYKQLWDGFRIPGERDHRELRWEIRERLAYQAPVPKARRSYVANSYVIPTDKKRSALRWEVRNRMAHPDLPHKFAYHF